MMMMTMTGASATAFAGKAPTISAAPAAEPADELTAQTTGRRWRLPSGQHEVAGYNVAVVVVVVDLALPQPSVAGKGVRLTASKVVVYVQPALFALGSAERRSATLSGLTCYRWMSGFPLPVATSRFFLQLFLLSLSRS